MTGSAYDSVFPLPVGAQTQKSCTRYCFACGVRKEDISSCKTLSAEQLARSRSALAVMRIT